MTRLFALASLPVMVLAAGLLFLAYRQAMETIIVTTTENVAASIAQIFTNELWPRYSAFLVEADTLSPDHIRQHATTRLILDDIRALTVQTDVVKIKLYTPSGKTVFSTDPSQIGGDYSRDEHFLQAMTGENASQFSARARFDAIDGPRSDLWVLGTYVPIRDHADGRRIVGIMEVYTDITPAVSEFLYGKPMLFVAVLIPLALLATFLFQTAVVSVTERRLMRENTLRLTLVQRLATMETANQAKSTFLANMSHELRTPLNAIIGFADVISEQLLGPRAEARYREYAGDIGNAGRHLSAIIEDVLDLAKVEAGRMPVRPERVDPGAIVDEALNLLRASADDAGVSLDCAIPSNLPVMRTDGVKLRQVILNIVSNAIKNTQTGGHVRLTVTAEPDGNAVAFEIKDDGVGMTAEELTTALEMFGQVEHSNTKRSQGTGLGLPLSKRFVELIGGSFAIESNPGIGTAVKLYIPVHLK